MKELTTEQKAQRYDEAIERAKALLSGNQLGNAWIYKLLPELKESEDERIRKTLLELFEYQIKESHSDKEWLCGVKLKDVVAWLEKQGESSKEIEYNPFDDFRNSDVEVDFNEKSLRPQNNITDEELAQAKKDAYNDALDKIEYHSGEPTFDDGWNAAILYLKKRNAMPQLQWKPSEEENNYGKRRKT